MAKRLHSPDMRHVRVGKDNTTITLEDEFWEQLRIIAVTRNVAISQLLAEIDRTMRLQPARPGYRRVRTLSAAVRVFVLQTLTSPPSNAGRHARRRSPRSPWSLPRGMHPSKAARAEAECKALKDEIKRCGPLEATGDSFAIRSLGADLRPARAR